MIISDLTGTHNPSNKDCLILSSSTYRAVIGISRSLAVPVQPTGVMVVLRPLQEDWLSKGAESFDAQLEFGGADPPLSGFIQRRRNANVSITLSTEINRSNKISRGSPKNS